MPGRNTATEAPPAGALDAGALDQTLFRAAFDGSALGTALVDEDDRFLAANPAFCALVGRTEAELAGMTCAQVTATADLPATRRHSAAVLSGSRPVARFEKRLVHASGAEIWVHVHLGVVAGPHGRRFRLVQTVDITDQKRAEVLAAQETERLEATIRVQQDVTGASRDRRAALQVVADRAIEVFAAADGAVVELLDDDALVYAAVAGTLTPYAGVRVQVDGSLSGRAVRQSVAMRCDDPETDPRVDLEACRRVGIGSMIIAPLFADDRAIGVLKVASGHTWAFDDTDIHQLQLMAGSLSAALRHADDFAEKTRLLAERGAALTRLEAANQLKLDLLGMLGHEIGTPLTVIIGYTDDAREDWDTLPPARRRAVLDVVSRNAHQLNALVREVLAMVSLDAGVLRVTREPVRIAEAVAAACQAAGIPEPGPVVDCPPDLVALVQPGHLRQALVNFLTNAVKYGGGPTAVRAYRVGRRATDRVRIDVVDEGPGVPEAFRARLFDRFARADHGDTTGTGLGLYIVRELARANDGDATYRPNTPTGSIFTVELDAALD